jgi:hypothetical protein
MNNDENHQQVEEEAEQISSIVADDNDDNANDDDHDNNNDVVDDSSSVASEETVEPEYDRANGLSFYTICQRMEKTWVKKKSKEWISEEERKKFLLPPKLVSKISPHSAYPWLRLLMPDIDNARQFGIKESTIIQIYCEAEGFMKGTTNANKLFRFTDPQIVPYTIAGDLSCVIEHVLAQRIPTIGSNVTVGEMNQFLDELASLKSRKSQSGNHDWRESQDQQPKKKKKTETALQLRSKWMQKVIARGLSPLEHKWMVRILLQKLEVGLSWRSLLTWYSPYSMELWNAHNSLRNLCSKLADTTYHQRRQEAEELERKMQQGALSRWYPQEQGASLGNTISPMLSNRVSFANCITQLHSNHEEYLSKAILGHEPLALKFPAICAEIKLDGERLVAHITQNGVVTMQTRNNRWYSEVYSPVLGPPLRRAIAKYNVSVILDGEVISWDNVKKEVVPFGSNRTVANYRRHYLYKLGLWDDRDKNLHQGQTELTVVRTSDDFCVNSPSDTMAGEECWLQFIAFDILFLGGPDAPKLFAECGIRTEQREDGSIIHLSGLERNQILYRLIEPQLNEVSICKSMVVRPNGECVTGEKYYSTTDPMMEYGHPVWQLDSTKATIEGQMPDLEEIDRLRRHGQSKEQIYRLRSHSIDMFYRKVVEEHRMEGIVIKDLAAPYIFGNPSRSRKVSANR